MPRRVKRKHTDKKALQIYWVTDLHIVASVEDNPVAAGATDGVSRYYYTVPKKLQRFIGAVNQNLPNLVICGGDVNDNSADFTRFNQLWGTIDGRVRKEITIGNHDLASATHDQLATAFGYSAAPVTAGSKFNQALSLSNGYASARVLMVDTNITDTSGTHISTNKGYLQSDAQTWINNELSSCVENTVLLFMHHGPHMYSMGYFDQTQATQLQSIVDNVKTARPNLRVYCFFGHHHIVDMQAFTNLGTNFKGYLGPALVEYPQTKYAIINILPNGPMRYKTVSSFYS